MIRIFDYRGKADARQAPRQQWHPLPYHCLDVAAVAWAWMEESPVVRSILLRAFAYSPDRYPDLRAWVAFFGALHDVGKFNALFQWMLRRALGETDTEADRQIDTGLVTGYRHGAEGYAQAVRELGDWTGSENEEVWDAWRPWLQAVTGHHGEMSSDLQGIGRYAAQSIVDGDRLARAEWVAALAEQFLLPAGLSLASLPPACSSAGQTWIAGFCAVCDWIGSNADIFGYCAAGPNLEEYFASRLAQVSSDAVLVRFGLAAESRPFAGLESLLGAGESPRGVQTLADDLPRAPGLTLIEAPTGAGKTEAALAHAWRLLDAGLAESIVFALPTQATANGMLPRAEAFANIAFGGANIVLAHGKRDFSDAFRGLLAARPTAQGADEAAVQCSAWLAQSRKRVFLGQFGVCTIDQALLSVLPVRHKFVRGFGIQRSVLIVDEVHAYDSYMHGLLGELLRQQREVGGSAILLSATLPSGLRAKLFEAWGAAKACDADAPYPVVWQVGSDGPRPLEVEPLHRPRPRSVAMECLKLPDARPDEALLARLLVAAKAGAKVAVVLNLVDAAQDLTRRLRQGGDIPVDIFHSRFRYCDRMEREREAMSRYGRERRAGGRILVATQVVEQSLDLDFDWLVTQICPVDLLFQRLGRLHRHERQRPPGFESPRCTVLSVEGEDYGSHAVIYGNTQVLWRTEGLLAANSEIQFPAAYRLWIERVYERDDWPGEPAKISTEHDKFLCMERQLEREAIALTKVSMTQFRDEDSRALSLTRGNEMGLVVLPVTPDGRTLDGEDWAELDDQERPEAASLNGIPVPATDKWKRALSGRYDDEGRCILTMERDGGEAWIGNNGNAVFRYSEGFGLELGKEGA